MLHCLLYRILPYIQAKPLEIQQKNTVQQSLGHQGHLLRRFKSKNGIFPIRSAKHTFKPETCIWLFVIKPGYTKGSNR